MDVPTKVCGRAAHGTIGARRRVSLPVGMLEAGTQAGSGEYGAVGWQDAKCLWVILSLSCIIVLGPVRLLWHVCWWQLSPLPFLSAPGLCELWLSSQPVGARDLPKTVPQHCGSPSGECSGANGQPVSVLDSIFASQLWICSSRGHLPCDTVHRARICASGLRLIESQVGTKVQQKKLASN